MDTKVLSLEDVNRAFSLEFDMCEENVLMYISGYFLRRLINMHKQKECDTCEQNGSKLESSESPNVSMNELFLYLKRFTSSSQLYKCSPHFISYVKAIIQLTIFSIENFFFMGNIGNMITNTALMYISQTPNIWYYQRLKNVKTGHAQLSSCGTNKKQRHLRVRRYH